LSIAFAMKRFDQLRGKGTAIGSDGT
jgi:hypothetical protein